MLNIARNTKQYHTPGSWATPHMLKTKDKKQRYLLHIHLTSLNHWKKTGEMLLPYITNQMQPPGCRMVVALDMSKAFYTVNIHILIERLLQSNISPTIITVHCKVYQKTQSLHNIQNHTSTTLQFKTGAPQGGILSPILFNLYTSDIPQQAVQVSSYKGCHK